MPGAVWRGAKAAHAAAIVRRAESRTAIRGLAYTPWLTVSFGLVVAAMVALAVPHPAITLPTAPDGTCVSVSCQAGHRIHGNPASKPRAPLTLPARRRSARTRHTRRVVRRHARPAAQVEVTFAVKAQRQDNFLASIEIRGQRPLGHWTLRFVLPGGTVARVQGGQWAASGQGVIVYGSAPSQGQSDQVQLLVYGSGTPGWPTSCAFDGKPCTFAAP